MHRNLLFLLIPIAAPAVVALAKESPEEPVSWTTSSRAPQADEALSGAWRILKGTGNPKAVAALPPEIRLDVDSVEQVPAEGNFKALDFHTPDGAVVRAIYRFSGATLIVSQSPPNAPRPKGFHPGDVICVWSAERK